jgi:RNA polymerase sigma-70 factor (sigma-E family)
MSTSGEHLAIGRTATAPSVRGSAPADPAAPASPPGGAMSGERAGEAERAHEGASAAEGTPADDFVRQLYVAHAVRMVRVGVLLLGDQASAEDVVQEAFFGLYRALPRLRDRAKAVPYLRAAVVNGARSVLRARKRAALGRLPYEPPVWSAEAAAMVGEERRELLAAVARLPRRAREVLALRYYLDLNDNEIAAALGISRGTVSSTASRALAALARELKEEL